MKTQTKSKYPDFIEKAYIHISGDRNVGIMPSSLAIDELYIDLGIWETEEEKKEEILRIRNELEQAFTAIYDWPASVMFDFESDKMSNDMIPPEETDRYISLRLERNDNGMWFRFADTCCPVKTKEGKKVGEISHPLGSGVIFQFGKHGEEDYQKYFVSATQLWNSFVSSIGKPEYKIKPKTEKSKE